MPFVIKDDTIAAVATPLGSGGLGVVRLSGPKAFAIASGLFRGSTPLDQCPSHTLHHGTITEGSEILDDGVAGLFRAPRSYTGEDVVEFSCHGGAHILRRVLESCLRAGARMADPGEFTRRAFLNGKIDLVQAEAVGDLIAARSDAQRRLALNALRGELSQKIQPLRDRILDLLAHLEAHLDFVEDEVPDLSRADIRKKIEWVTTDLTAFVAEAGPARLWREGIKIAIVGRPNAGKSSLFNALLKENRAIVADVPGTTRDTLEESVVWEGISVTLVDTAGLRETADTVEREGADRARRVLAEADVVFLVVDAGQGPLAEDRAAAQAVRDRPVVMVLNKMDLLKPRSNQGLHPGESRDEVRKSILENSDQNMDPGRSHAAFPANAVSFRRDDGFKDWKKELGLLEAPAVFVSALTSDGLDELRRAALRLAGGGQEPLEPGIIFNARQEQRVRESVTALNQAVEAAKAGAPEEILAMDIRLALAGLNAVTGQGAPEEVLDAIFSRFCVGK